MYIIFWGPNQVELKVTIDRFEGNFAVLLVHPEESIKIDWPKAFLPKGSQEGDILSISLERDIEETAETKKNVSLLLDKLINKNKV